MASEVDTTQGGYPATGEIVSDRYRVLGVLGAGGMGKVFLAEHVIIGKRVALKVLAPALARDQALSARFLQEARIASQIRHENVVDITDFGATAGGLAYFVMEYLEGMDLRALVQTEGRVPWIRARKLIRQVCAALQAAHDLGVVHRDMKPENVLLCRGEADRVVVLDFGIAKVVASALAGRKGAGAAATREGSILGTPGFMAPEQAQGLPVDPRTDVYATGCVLYYLLTGQAPFEADNDLVVLTKHLTEAPRPPSMLGPDGSIPSVADLLVMKALAKEPAKRWASMSALIAALDELEQGREPSLLGASTVVAVPDASIASTLPTRPRRARRASAMVLAMAALAGIAFAVSRWPRERVPVFVDHPLSPATRFYVRPPDTAAIQQTAALSRAGAAREAAAMTAMLAVPQAVWFETGTPDEVRDSVRNTIIQAGHAQAIPILVPYYLPYRDCTTSLRSGAKDAAAYRAWIDGFGRGIGNERAVVIYEPNSSVTIPHSTFLDGAKGDCKPTVTNGRGETVPAPGATPAETYRLIKDAMESLRKQAPNALVYLDGGQVEWPVSEIAYRLFESGVLGGQGFAVNGTTFFSTRHSIRFATWVAKCLYYATRLAKEKNTPEAFRACPSPPWWFESTDENAWAEKTEKWYSDNVDHSADPPGGPTALAHFVVDTSRNGQPLFNPYRYASFPYNQPAQVVDNLFGGAFCNPPGAGVGLRPTADTGVPLADAYVWIKTAGQSDGSCDIARGIRDWDFTAYNPWGLTGDTQKHFDPLWGLIDPAAGAWFPEHALELAQNAVPPLVP
jgi:endoglucanase